MLLMLFITRLWRQPINQTSVARIAGTAVRAFGGFGQQHVMITYHQRRVRKGCCRAVAALFHNAAMTTMQITYRSGAVPPSPREKAFALPNASAQNSPPYSLRLVDFIFLSIAFPNAAMAAKRAWLFHLEKMLQIPKKVL